MSITSKNEASGLEVARTESNTVPVKRRKRQTCARHCKRFWWIYAIVSAAIIILIVCLIIFVAVPKIAQHKVNDADLEIQGVTMLETTEGSFTLSINSTITTDGKIGAKIYPFEGVMYLEDLEAHTPFVTLNFPETSGKKHQQINITQDIDISDLDAFTTFNTWFAANETLRVTVEGKTKLKPSGLDRKYSVNFKKTVTVNGLNQFNGTEVTEGEIITTRGAEYNFLGKADIPNHSVFTLDIGNVSFINYIKDDHVGSLYIENLLLQPGDNNVDIKGNIDQITVLSLIRTPEYCKTGIIPFKLNGDNVTNSGENLTYFANALGSFNQTVDINIGKIIADSLGAEVGCAKED